MVLRTSSDHNLTLQKLCTYKETFTLIFYICPHLVDGGLTSWTPFSTCSKSCGEGTQERLRTCTNPAPKHGGKDCSGQLKESRNCKEKECPGKTFSFQRCTELL